MVKKLIKFKDKVLNMTVEEVCNQFEALVYKLASKWLIRYELEDMKQVASIGLIKAYNSYNIEKDVLFLTWAMRIVSGELSRNYRNDKSKNLDCVSCNIHVSGIKDTETEMIELFSDDTDYEEKALNNIEYERLHSAIDKLEPQEKEIIQSMMFKSESQTSIAKRFNKSQGQISRQYKRALENLKNIMEDDNMPRARITKHELMREIEKYGTKADAIKFIAQKYELSTGTIKNYLDEWDIRKYSKDYTGQKNRTKEHHEREELSVKENDITNVVDHGPILQEVKVYKGAVGEYEIHDTNVNLKLNNELIVLEKSNIDNLILELQELRKVI